jgi:hypothetical protein
MNGKLVSCWLPERTRGDVGVEHDRDGFFADREPESFIYEPEL